MRFYEALGLEPMLSLDAQDLQKRFYERSRQWHPDRFARASGAEQQKALDMTAVLNDAFRTLRDPVARAGYFLEEHKVASSKHPPAELLEEVFEMNMALDELRSGDESVRPQLEHARDRFLKLRDEIDHGLSALFIQYDKSLHANPDESLLLAVRGVLDRRQYVSNLIRDVEKELNVHVSN